MGYWAPKVRLLDKDGIKGVLAFLVDKDIKVTVLDLELAGIRPVKEPGELYTPLLEPLAELEIYMGYNLMRSPSRMKVCRFKNRKIICKIYLDPNKRKRVKAVVFVTLSPGVLHVLSSQLEKMGWKRIFMVEVSKRVKGRLKGRGFRGNLI